MSQDLLNLIIKNFAITQSRKKKKMKLSLSIKLNDKILIS